MSEEEEDSSDRISVNVVSNDTAGDEKIMSPENDCDELSKELESMKEKNAEYEDKLKHVLADFQNLSRKTQSDIENGVSAKVDEFILNFLEIYDDFKRARKVFAEGNTGTEGLDGILKNMDSLLAKYQVRPIDALGEIFDPNYHEAISVVNDNDLDDGTITKEIRKGYISQTRVIRPTLVEISKKEDMMKNGQSYRN